MREKVLSVKNLYVSYEKSRLRGLSELKENATVRNISLEVRENEVVALVGESGSGKTTVARALAGLVPFLDGQISVTGTEISKKDKLDGQISVTGTEISKKDKIGGASRQDIQVVFQDPRSSLNPRMTVRGILSEGPRARGIKTRGEDWEVRLQFLMRQVGLTSEALDSRPHQLSGGQCQRVSIARALSLEPSLLICDEAVSALDVSVQAQVLNLLKDLKTKHGLSMLFITHDLGVVRQLCDRVAVMSDGEIVEFGDTEDVYSNPQDPYTQQLLASALDVSID